MELELMTPKQLADAMGVTPNTVKRWRLDGEGPAHIRVGNTIRYHRRDVEKWMESKKEAAR